MKNLLLFVTVLLLPFALSAQTQSKKAKQFAESYLQVSNKEQKPGEYLAVRKWKTDTTYTFGIIGKPKGLKEKDIEAYMSEIGEIIGIKFQRKDEASAHFLVYFGKLSEFHIYSDGRPYTYGEDVINRNLSYYLYRINKANEYTRYHLGIDTDKLEQSRDAHLHTKRYLLQAFGLFLGLNEEYNMLSKKYDREKAPMRLTKKDRDLIRLHYQPEIKSGMLKDRLAELIEQMDLDAFLKKK